MQTISLYLKLVIWYNKFMSESVLREKAKEFAKNIIFITREIKANNKESVLTNQLLRSGTSIGANIHEAQYAQGTADFISKLEIALKECFESEYWLELLHESGYINNSEFDSIYEDCQELMNMVVASTKTLQGKNNSYLLSSNS